MMKVGLFIFRIVDSMGASNSFNTRAEANKALTHYLKSFGGRWEWAWDWEFKGDGTALDWSIANAGMVRWTNGTHTIWSSQGIGAFDRW